MKKTSYTLQLFTLFPILFIPAVVLLLANFILNQQEESYLSSVAQIESDFVQTEKARVRTKVNNMVDLVTYRQSIINNQLHNRIQRRVDDAHKIALALFEFYKDQKPIDEIKQLIVESLRPLSWNGGESYIWLIDFDGYLQLGPDYLKPLEGQSIIGFEDVNGRKVIQEEIAIATGQEKGFLWDAFTKPGEPKDKQFKQLAYIKKLGLFDWYIGSAEFLDTATKRTHAELLEAINQIGKGGSDYIFVIDADGNLLLNYARPDIVGRNMQETKDKNLHALFNKMIAASETLMQEFISYNWINPKSGLVDNKMTYLKKVPSSKWVVGSGFYPKMLEQGYDAKLQRLTTEYNQKTKHFTTLMWLSVFGAFIIASLMSMAFQRVIQRYRMNLELSTNELKSLNIDLEQSLLEKNRELKQREGQLANYEHQEKSHLFVNKKIILSRLEEEMQRAWVYKKPLSVVRFEIENHVDLVSAIGREKTEALYSAMGSVFKVFTQDNELIGQMNNHTLLLIIPGLSAMQATKQVESLLNDVQSITQNKDQAFKIEFKVAEYGTEASTKQLLDKLSL